MVKVNISQTHMDSHSSQALVVNQEATHKLHKADSQDMGNLLKEGIRNLLKEANQEGIRNLLKVDSQDTDNLKVDRQEAIHKLHSADSQDMVSHHNNQAMDNLLKVASQVMASHLKEEWDKIHTKVRT